MDDGTVNINLANANLKDGVKVKVSLDGISGKVQNARILVSDNIKDHNTFDNPDKVTVREFKKAKISNGVLTVDMPAASIVCLQIK